MTFLSLEMKSKFVNVFGDFALNIVTYSSYIVSIGNYNLISPYLFYVIEHTLSKECVGISRKL